MKPLLPLALLALPAAAEDLQVGPPGSGAAFTSIQAAIDAADTQDDRILVAPGIYTGSLVIDGKDIEILGAGAGLSVLRPTLTSEPQVLPHLQIRNTLPDQSVSVSGFEFGVNDFFGGAAYETHVFVSGARGPVSLSGLDLRRTETGVIKPLFHIVRVTGSDRVVLSDCDVRATDGSLFFTTPNPEGPAGVRVQGSSVWINDCRIEGGAGRGTSAVNPTTGGAAVDAENSSVAIGWSTLLGGQGGSQPLQGPPQVGGRGGAALKLDADSRALLSGGVTLELTGGPGLAGSGSIGAGGPALETLAGSAAFLDPASPLAGGLDGLEQLQAPGLLDDGSPGSGSTVLGPLVAQRLTPSAAAPGSSLELQFQGPGGAVLLAYVSSGLGSALELPGLFGDLLIDPLGAGSPIVIQSAPNGSASLSATLPSTVPVGLQRFVQTVAIELTTGSSIAPPSVLTVR